jgi:hypothetical protein
VDDFSERPCRRFQILHAKFRIIDLVFTFAAAPFQWNGSNFLLRFLISKRLLSPGAPLKKELQEFDANLVGLKTSGLVLTSG